MARLDSLFTIKYGDHNLSAKDDLDKGSALIVSSQGVDNGCYGFFDAKIKFHEPVISVPRTGSIGEAFVQLHPCNIDDNCLVLIPKKKMSKEYLFYIASEIRLEKWRYTYGRQITPSRLGRLEVISDSDFKTSLNFDILAKHLMPLVEKPARPLSYKEPIKKKFQITDLFELQRGHFHAIDKLRKGRYITISRVADDNGLVGFYDKPKKASVFDKFIMTVSTVTGDTFLQYWPFIATDNVVICIPKRQFRITTLMYIQAAINKVKWRYSYGRQCYKGTLQKTVFFLPCTSSGKINEEYIEKLITNLPFWRSFHNKLTGDHKN